MPEMDISRRGNPDFAGRICQSHGSRMNKAKPCHAFARYEVVTPLSGEAFLSCGAHMAEFIRAVWLLHETAAVVREVPGMWREHR